MPPLSSGVSVAARIPVSDVREEGPAVDDRSGIPALSELRRGGLDHSGDRVRADANLVADLVGRHVVRDQSERRGECPGSDKRSWLREFSNGLDVVAPIEACYGPSWSGSTLRTH